MSPTNPPVLFFLFLIPEYIHDIASPSFNLPSGLIVAISFGNGAYEEAARANLEQGLEIELKTVKQILGEGSSGSRP